MTSMWAHEYTAESAVSPEAIWAVLSDLDRWPRWDTSMERVALQGPFAVGTRVSMTPVGQDPIVGLSAPEFYADRTDLGPVTLEFSPTLTRLDAGGTRIAYRLEITGDGAAELGLRLRITPDGERVARQAIAEVEQADQACFRPAAPAGLDSTGLDSTGLDSNGLAALLRPLAEAP